MHRAPARPGVTSVALLSILVITAAWWALALWPAGGVQPEWLVRTRAVCFGSAPGGLPDAGGWIVLIGEPVGMLGVLLLVWGGALRADLRRLSADWRWRVVMLLVVVAMLGGMAKAGQQVALASGMGTPVPPAESGTVTRVDIDMSAHALIDQRGERISLADFRGRPVILTFAFGHCATVCPLAVRQVLEARSAANRQDVPLVVITLDPWRDTPDRLPTIVSEWALGPRDYMLSGSIEQVGRALDALGVRRWRDERTGDIEHVSMVMATDDRGHVGWRLDGGWGGVRELLATLPASGGAAPGSW
jgi:protein SCO1/2